ncbi:MAG: hypothetical protein NT091_03545, partial [Candidatus Falkowbacteria bacterium]|nr:hypothetical protein [Candidatus Falkowbacteria bacterium]
TLDLLPDGSVYQIIVTSHSSALAQALYYRIRKGTISPVHSFSSEAGSSNANKQAEAEIARLQSGIAQYQNAMKGLRENFDIIKLQCDQAITECAQAVTECNKAKAEAKASENKANAYEKKLVEIAHYIEWVKDYLRRTIVAVEGSSTWGLKDKVLIHLRKIEKADIHEYLDGPDSQDDAA